jgi:hypothetical protein
MGTRSLRGDAYLVRGNGMRFFNRLVLGSVGCLFFAILAAGSLLAAPVISSLNPTSGASGTSVVITGSSFGSSQGSSTVKFGSAVASVTNWSSSGNSITATVPSGLANGSVNVVVTVSGTASNAVAFTVTNPIINSLSINSAPVDQEITINGSYFGLSQGTNSTVTFNGTTAVPSLWGNSQIVVPVPTGATTGNIVVTVNANSSPGFAFMVTPGPQPPGVDFVQGDYLTPTNPGASITVPFPIEQNGGDLNVVVVSWRGTNTVKSCTDTAGNSYTLAVGPTAGTSRIQAIY